MFQFGIALGAVAGYVAAINKDKLAFWRKKAEDTTKAAAESVEAGFKHAKEELKKKL